MIFSAADTVLIGRCPQGILAAGESDNQSPGVRQCRGRALSKPGARAGDAGNAAGQRQKSGRTIHRPPRYLATSAMKRSLIITGSCSITGTLMLPDSHFEMMIVA